MQSNTVFFDALYVQHEKVKFLKLHWLMPSGHFRFSKPVLWSISKAKIVFCNGVVCDEFVYCTNMKRIVCVWHAFQLFLISLVLQIFVANIGDAKAVVARSTGTDGLQNHSDKDTPLKAIVVTREHKAIYPQERARIQKVGKPWSNGFYNLAFTFEVVLCKPGFTL